MKQPFSILMLPFMTCATFPTKAQTTSDIVSAQTDSAQFAVLYVYTNSSFRDHFMMTIDNSAVCPLFANSKAEIKLYKQGDRQISVGE
jgi:hypothetical protein